MVIIMDKKLGDKINKRGNNSLPRIAETLPLISDYSSRVEWENASWQKILSSKELLELLITASERHDLVMRAAALNRLIAGKNYKQIGDELWLSPQTISNIKKILREKSYQSYSERSKKERKKKKYSSDSKSSKSKLGGMPRRTKYGTIYMP